MKNPSYEMLIAAWQTATLKQRAAALIALQSDSEPTTSVPPGEVLPRCEVAKRFHRHPSFVDRLVRSGALRPVRFQGRKRGCGFRASDVEGLINAGV